MTAVPWRRLVRYPQTWAFACGKFLTDPIWWLYLFWIPDFLSRTYGLDLKNLGLPLVAFFAKLGGLYSRLWLAGFYGITQMLRSEAGR